MKKIILALFALSALGLNAQVLIGVNTRFNNFTAGVDANGAGIYGMVGYGKVKQGIQYPLFRGDKVPGHLHPINANYTPIDTATTQTTTNLMFGVITNNNNSLRVGVHVGVNSVNSELFTNHNEPILGEFSVLRYGITRNYLLLGTYINYRIGWLRIDVTSQKRISTNFGIFIPLCGRKTCR